jgi:hypothetical protein
MPNKRYQRGVALERLVVHAFRETGCTTWRSAGSHGPFDVQILGTLDQLVDGWDVLSSKGFYAVGDCHHKRVTTRQEDWLMNQEFRSLTNPDQRVLLIQCKRGKHGKNTKPFTYSAH